MFMNNLVKRSKKDFQYKSKWKVLFYYFFFTRFEHVQGFKMFMKYLSKNIEGLSSNSLCQRWKKWDLFLY